MASQALKRRCSNGKNRLRQGPGRYDKRLKTAHGIDAKQHSKMDVNS